MDYENSFDRLEQESLFDESDPYFFRIEDNVPKDSERITHCFFTGHRSLPEEQKAALLVPQASKPFMPAVRSALICSRRHRLLICGGHIRICA